jgi:monothiol glutaredoxin
MMMVLSESLRKQISDLLARDRVVLFMKGNRHMPQCGFSAQVVSILDGLLPNYETVDVLQAPELRDGIKEFSEWPTIPQLYVGGQFVGGCDIVRDMSASGELQRLLGVEVAPTAPPSVALSAAAAKAIEAAAPGAGGDPLHLQIDARFQHDLFFAPRAPGDLEVRSNGVLLLIDPPSARLAGGVSIDFVDGPGGGFKIDNPNAPPTVKQLTASEAKAMLDRGEVVLFDVRPETERRTAKIAAARSLDAAGQAYLMALDRGTPVVFHCHHGVRSQAAAEQALGAGFKNVYNLKGGIDAWSTAVDPSVPRY